jgi:hypothetical protein
MPIYKVVFQSELFEYMKNYMANEAPFVFPSIAKEYLILLQSQVFQQNYYY